MSVHIELLVVFVTFISLPAGFRMDSTVSIPAGDMTDTCQAVEFTPAINKFPVS
jgi:hypothetical protein